MAGNCFARKADNLKPEEPEVEVCPFRSNYRLKYLKNTQPNPDEVTTYLEGPEYVEWNDLVRYVMQSRSNY